MSNTTTKTDVSSFDAPPPYAPPTAPVAEGYQQQPSVQYVQATPLAATRTVYLDQQGRPIEQVQQQIPRTVYVDQYGREVEPVGVDDHGRVQYGAITTEPGRGRRHRGHRSRSSSPLLDRDRKHRRRRHSSSDSEYDRRKQTDQSGGCLAGLGACCAAMIACSCITSLLGGDCLGFGLPFFGGGPGFGRGHGHGGGFGGGFGGFGGGGGGGPGGP